MAVERRWYNLSILAVTKTHLPGEGDVEMDAEEGYRLVFSERLDGTNVEGVGIAPLIVQWLPCDTTWQCLLEY